MSLSAQEVLKLNRIINLAEKLIENGTMRSAKVGSDKPAKGSTRIRRTGRKLSQFRKKLKAERKKGIPVAELARKHGISTGYIYML